MQIPIPIRRIGQSLSSNSPTILSGLAVAGVVATAVLAVRATPKVVTDLEEFEIAKNTWAEAAEKVEGSEPDLVPLTKVEIVQVSWKAYLPAMITGAATIACIIGSNQIGLRRNIALAGAYTLVDTAFREYKDEVLTQLGAAKERKVADAVLVKQMEKNPPVQDSQVVMIGGSDVLCYESLSGRYFRSTAEDLRRAENDLNADLLNHSMYVDLNLWFDYLGLEHTDLGSILGWNVEKKLDTFFTSHISPNGEPCLAIGYKVLPFKGFGDL
jgi:hypothetical protein